MVNHGILFDKLEFYGIHGLALDWIHDYFANRFQFVIVTKVLVLLIAQLQVEILQRSVKNILSLLTQRERKRERSTLFSIINQSIYLPHNITLHYITRFHYIYSYTIILVPFYNPLFVELYKKILLRRRLSSEKAREKLNKH
jgi:hypothetical protein